MTRVDLTTQYLGLRLEHPIMPGASPLVDDMDKVRRLEDAGAPAIVMHSLFEEQLVAEQIAAYAHWHGAENLNPEAQSYFPSSAHFALGSEAYLNQLRRIRDAVSVPLIASLNGVSLGGWIEYAHDIQRAGADALELNLYAFAADPEMPAAAVEAKQLEVIRAVTAAVTIPVAVKLSPFYSALPAFVREAGKAGAAGVIVFNRLYQPDIDIEALELQRRLHLSDESELLLRLRWLAILSSRTDLSLACSGGVHSSTGVIKSMMAGAHAVQVVSALLRHGPELLGRLKAELARWLEEHEYSSVAQLRGSMNDARAPDPSAYERANYVHLLQTWHGPPGRSSP